MKAPPIACPVCNAIFVARAVAKRCPDEHQATQLRESADALERMHQNPASAQMPDLMVACITAVQEATTQVLVIDTIDLPTEAFDAYLEDICSSAAAAHDAEVARLTAMDAATRPSPMRSAAPRGPSIAIPPPKGGALA